MRVSAFKDLKGKKKKKKSHDLSQPLSYSKIVLSRKFLWYLGLFFALGFILSNKTVQEVKGKRATNSNGFFQHS